MYFPANISFRTRNFLSTVKARFTYKKLMNTIDLDRFEAIKKKYTSEADSIGHRKYFEIKKWIPLNLAYVYFLGLSHSSRARILDIGTGFGYFPFACKYHGHDVLSLDVQKSLMYDEMVEFLEVPRQFFRIEAYKQLPDFGRKFDLVTALMVCFANHKKPNRWEVPEWDFLLNDLKHSQLTPNGKVFMTLNRDNQGLLYNDELKEYFVSKGAKLNGCKVYFDNMNEF